MHKLNSLLASFAALRFAHHMREQFAGIAADVEVLNEAVASLDYPDDSSRASTTTTTTSTTTSDNNTSTGGGGGSSSSSAPVAGAVERLRVAKYSAATLAKLADGGGALFDARLVVLDTPRLVAEHMLWRQRCDCRRNSVHGLALLHFGHRTLNGTSTIEQLDMLRRSDVHYTHADDQFRIGVFAKRGIVECAGVDPRTNATTSALRYVIVEVRCVAWF